jgi:hypothetical protein
MSSPAARSDRSGWLRARLREAVAEVYGTDCCRCGRPIDMTLPGQHRDGPSFDHLELSSEGGPDHFTNLRLAHLHCNRKQNGHGRRQLAIARQSRQRWGPVAGQGVLL